MAGDESRPAGGLSAPWFLAPGARLKAGEVVVLPEAESRHLRARRVAQGDAVVVTDGSGLAATGRLSSGAGVLLGTVFEGVGEPDVRVTVLLSAAEPVRVEWAVEKGTECGAAAFLLVAAERSQLAHVTDLSGSRRRERLSRIAAEAAKQCRRSRVPEVRGPVPLLTALEQAPRPLVLLAPGGAPLASPGPGQLSVLVGPEGGFSPAEVERLSVAGALPGGLGPRTLRLETAVVAALVRLVDRGG